MTHPAAFRSGIAVLAAAWLVPLLLGSTYSFSVHMTVHMAVVAFAAPLLAVGAAGGRFDPVRRWPRVFSPIAASVLEFVVVWVWHMPLPRRAAEEYWMVLVLEQLTFLAAGLMLWISVLGGSKRARRERFAAGLAALLITAMHMTLLGALLALATRPLYEHRHAVLWMSPLRDQQLGGAIMLLAGGLSYLAGGLWLAVQILKPGPIETPPRQLRLLADPEHRFPR